MLLNMHAKNTAWVRASSHKQSCDERERYQVGVIMFSVVECSEILVIISIRIWPRSSEVAIMVIIVVINNFNIIKQWAFSTT